MESNFEPFEPDEKYSKTNEEVSSLVDEVSKILKGIFYFSKDKRSVSEPD